MGLVSAPELWAAYKAQLAHDLGRGRQAHHPNHTLYLTLID